MTDCLHGGLCVCFWVINLRYVQGVIHLCWDRHQHYVTLQQQAGIKNVSNVKDRCLSWNTKHTYLQCCTRLSHCSVDFTYFLKPKLFHSSENCNFKTLSCRKVFPRGCVFLFACSFCESKCCCVMKMDRSDRPVIQREIKPAGLPGEQDV